MKLQSDRSVQSDIIYFKEDVLRTLKMIETKLNTKLESSSSLINETLQSYNTQLNSFQNKIDDLSNIISTDKEARNKIALLLSFKTNTENTITTHDIKINRNEIDLQNAIYKYDKAILDNIYYPGVIGNNCKFRSLRDFVDFTTTNISSLNTFKDKNILDLKSYKSKLDTLIKRFQSQLDTITLTLTQFVDKKINESEERIKSLMKIYDDRLEDMRVENGKYAIMLKKKTENMMIELDKVINIKEEIYQKVNKEIDYMKGNVNEVSEKFEGYKGEFKVIKQRFTQLSEFIKDLRFRKNAGKQNLSKKEAMKMSSLINFKRKQTFHEDNNNVHIINNNTEKSHTSSEKKKQSISSTNINQKSIKNSVMVESFLKKYINGEVDINSVMSPSSRKSFNALNESQKNSILKRSESMKSNKFNSSIDLKGSINNLTPMNKTIEPFVINEKEKVIENYNKESSEDDQDSSLIVPNDNHNPNRTIISEEKSEIENEIHHTKVVNALSDNDENKKHSIKANDTKTIEVKEEQKRSKSNISSLNNKVDLKLKHNSEMNYTNHQLNQSKSYTIFPPLKKNKIPTSRFRRNPIRKDDFDNDIRKQMIKNIFTKSSSSTARNKDNMFRTFNYESSAPLTPIAPLAKKKKKITISGAVGYCKELNEEEVKGGIHYLTLSKILTHVPKTLPNDKKMFS